MKMIANKLLPYFKMHRTKKTPLLSLTQSVTSLSRTTEAQVYMP